MICAVVCDSRSRASISRVGEMVFESDSESDLEIITPSETLKQATSTANNILPAKSKARYEVIYQKFIDWRLDKNINSFSEKVLLTYFEEISEKLKPSSLWAMYSMLRSVINIKQNIDLANYQKLKAFLKRKSHGFQRKKSEIFSAENIRTFLDEAPDAEYLLSKVILVMGVSGACRKQELKDLKVDDIEDLGTKLIIQIPDSIMKIKRSFIISGNFYQICKKYINIRKNVVDPNTSRFFLNYQKGKCTRQVVGINKIGIVPKQIAEFLKLPHPATYTGHCLRRTATTILFDGGDMVVPKRHGGSKSSTVAEQYVDDSRLNKAVTANRIINESIQRNVNDENLEDLQHSTDRDTICTATDPLSFGIPATKKRKNVKEETKDTDDEFPLEDQYVVKTEPMEFAEVELPTDEKLNTIKFKQNMEQQKNPLEDIEQDQYFLLNNDMNQDMSGSTICIKKEPILSDMNETRHLQDFATPITLTWEDFKALQDENERLKNENEALKQHILKLENVVS